MSNKSKKSHTRGFTIIEMLISIFIFTVALGSLMYMSSRGLRSAQQSRHKVTAEFLAVEGIEVVRNIRDRAFFTGSAAAWSNVFQGDDFFDPDNGCYDDDGDSDYDADPCEYNLDTSGSWVLEQCSDECRLYLDTTDDVYEYSGSASEQSPYTREIFIREISDEEVEVNVVVSWNGGSVSYVNNMFLWKKND
jgi:prepilin-type N-terminal cleavage/methylation domain-containing protein